jgi:predicted ribosome quality control (RQC) complex YloA/Tae2 family protein
LSRVRLLGVGDALLLELSGAGREQLVLDVSRSSAGLYLLTREEAAALYSLRGSEPKGRARHALLLFRKHLDGARVDDVRRVGVERHLILACGDATLSHRLGGGPGLTLAVLDEAVATLGREAWPPPRDSPQRPGAESPGPALLLAVPPERLTDADLAGPSAVRVASSDARVAPLASVGVATWREAFARFLLLRARGDAFAARRRERLEASRRELRRLRALEGHLEQDALGQADPEVLRRQAEALLAAPAAVPRGATEAVVPDPYQASEALHVRLDPSLDAIANAERLFDKARRSARGRVQVATRLEQTRRLRAQAEVRAAALEAARTLTDLETKAAPKRAVPALRSADAARGPRRYLTSRGLSLYVGRGARENHRLTFSFARPEDVWLHARNVPGAHVILRDDEGRAGSGDIREAAEVAAFFSDAKQERAVDVHCARRKHLRPAKGQPGRVLIGHSDTLRVTPRDPEGRLRRR